MLRYDGNTADTRLRSGKAGGSIRPVCIPGADPERSSSADSTGEQAELEDDIVAGNSHPRRPDERHIVGIEDKYGEVELVGGLQQTAKDAFVELKRRLVPHDRLGELAQARLECPRGGQLLARRSDEDGRLWHAETKCPRRPRVSMR